MESFSDGVIAILITIMVFDIKPPAGADFSALRSLVPLLLTYLMSFVYLAIYWNNHHHMLQMTDCVTGGILWANLHLLFWLSLMPFATHWLQSSHFAPIPVLVYGTILLLAAMAFLILQSVIIRAHGPAGRLAVAVGARAREVASVFLYAVAMAIAVFAPLVSVVIYAFVALMWLNPDRRIESKLDAYSNMAKLKRH